LKEFKHIFMSIIYI